MPDLSDRDLAMLRVETRWFSTVGAKEDFVRREFGMSMTRYHQVLNALISTDQALAADPLTVNRLRRLRDRRAAARSGRRLSA